ncbi:histidinol-phosphate transaminase [Candidatus Paracaedibacter symbiosus]|uniref:histidinol-phosphate transaminase n=1 Tax=Candidatus Paracaedibacter symbiosus TaxID=244582 RepID=UPI000509D242|nr:histidinol-phosphate transaminase [Candidatus Paracaedibacter symbiosus]
MTIKAHPSIYKITPYVGGDITPEGMSRRIVLASNENPYGCSPQVSDTLKAHIHHIHSYPSGGAASLKQAIANHFLLDPQQILCGNGSEDILHLVARCFAGPGDEVISPHYGFQVYRIAAMSVGATLVYAPQPNYISEIEAILSSITPRTKIIYLDNPANPLGTYLDKGKLRRLIEQTPPHIIIVLDAAYADYLEEADDYTSGFELVEKHPNLIITRTFSKLYGLASLRLGWCYSSVDVIHLLNRIRPPFNVNKLAQIAGIAAIGDQEWAKNVRQKMVQIKENFIKFLHEKSYRFLPSGGNFVSVEFPEAGPHNAKETYQHLGKNGILVRPVLPYGLPNHLRITIGTADEMVELCDALEARI